MYPAIRVANSINVLYPGGLAAFREQGGELLYLPLPEDKVLLAHPAMEPAIREKLQKALPQAIIENGVLFTTDEEREVLRLICEKYFHQILTLTTSPGAYVLNAAALVVSLPMIRSDHEMAMLCMKELSEIPDLRRAYILFSDKCLNVTMKHRISVPVLKKQNGIRQTITPDDVTNLRITINLCNGVDDLLKLL